MYTVKILNWNENRVKENSSLGWEVCLLVSSECGTCCNRCSYTIHKSLEMLLLLCIFITSTITIIIIILCVLYNVVWYVNVDISHIKVRYSKLRKIAEYYIILHCRRQSQTLLNSICVEVMCTRNVRNVVL